MNRLRRLICLIWGHPGRYENVAEQQPGSKVVRIRIKASCRRCGATELWPPTSKGWRLR